MSICVCMRVHEYVFLMHIDHTVIYYSYTWRQTSYILCMIYVHHIYTDVMSKQTWVCRMLLELAVPDILAISWEISAREFFVKPGQTGLDPNFTRLENL